MVESPVSLIAKIGKKMIENAHIGSCLSRQLPRPIPASGVQDDDIVGPLKAIQAGADIRFFVQGQDDDADWCSFRLIHGPLSATP